MFPTCEKKQKNQLPDQLDYQAWVQPAQLAQPDQLDYHGWVQPAQLGRWTKNKKSHTTPEIPT